ncbi:MAG: hypothetical protein ACKVOA_02570 [Methylophilaceae bacterium]
MDYIAKAKKLTKVERERILSRMDGKLPKQLKKDKITEEKAIALQLEFEDVQLAEWREKMAEMRAKELAKTAKAKAKADAKLPKSKSKEMNTTKKAPTAKKVAEKTSTKAK